MYMQVYMEIITHFGHLPIQTPACTVLETAWFTTLKYYFLCKTWLKIELQPSLKSLLFSSYQAGILWNPAKSPWTAGMSHCRKKTKSQLQAGFQKYDHFHVILWTCQIRYQQNWSKASITHFSSFRISANTGRSQCTWFYSSHACCNLIHNLHTCI